MKGSLFFLFLLLISIQFGIAQELKFVTVRHNGMPSATETYQVLKDDKKVKHGSYTMTYGNMIAKGQYENNKRVGIWYYTNNQGQAIQTIDFTNNAVLYAKPFDIMLKDSSYVTPDEAPVFIGGSPTLLYHVMKNIKYPEIAKRNSYRARVFITGVVTKDGKLEQEAIFEGPDTEVNEAALRAVEKLPDEWIPGKIKGQPVDVKVKIPIDFMAGPPIIIRN